MPMMFDSSASYQGPELEMRWPVSSTHCSRAISGSNETSSWKPSKFSKNPCKCQKIHWIDRSGALILNSCLWLSRRVVFRVAKPHPKVMWLQRSQASIWRRSHGMYLDPAASRSSEGRFRYCGGLLSIAGIDMSTWHFLLAKRCRKCSQVHPLKQKGSLFVLLSFFDLTFDHGLCSWVQTCRSWIHMDPYLLCRTEAFPAAILLFSPPALFQLSCTAPSWQHQVARWIGRFSTIINELRWWNMVRHTNT